MKIPYSIIFAFFSCGLAYAAESDNYINLIRQFQTPSAVAWDASASVAANGEQLSALEIKENGARFELWTLNTLPTTGVITEYLLSSNYVASYIPSGAVYIRTVEDPNPQAAIAAEIAEGLSPTPRMPRTRADQSFSVDIAIGGLLKGATDPEASKSVNIYRHVQSYGVGGTGVGIDRNQATQLTASSIADNGTQTLTYSLTSIPGSNLTKIRGEERFTVKSLPDIREDYSVPPMTIESKFIQVWPVADGSINGITSGQLVRYSAPQLTLTMNDLYPSSTTYAQAYKGDPQLGVEGKIIPGSSLIINDSVPNSRVLVLKGYESVFEEDGIWTIELITKTPFGTDRLAYVSFNLDRTMKVKGTFTTIE